MTLILVLFCLVVTGIWFPEIRSLLTAPSGSGPTVEFPTGKIVTVEIADSQAEHVQGLSGHAPLEDDEGMLFIFSNKEIQGFWMKDMLFAIDIIWMDGERIVGFQQDAQPENPAKTIYYSPEPVDHVLEVQAGFVAQNDVHVGDLLDADLTDQ